MKSILFAGVAALVLSACIPQQNSGEELNNLSGNWTLTAFPGQSKTFSEYFTMKTPDLLLDVPKRRVSGSTGCNRITGDFEIEREKFRFGTLATTRMGCPGYDEGIYLEALSRVNRFKVHTAVLSFFQDSTLLMTFVKSSNVK